MRLQIKHKRYIIPATAMAKKKTAPPAQFDFDLICIGSGSGGGAAAVMAAKRGLKVALVEGGDLGGESPNYSSIPVHACLRAVHNLAAVRAAPQTGIEVGRVRADWERVLAFKDRCVKQTGVLESAAVFEKAGIRLFRGFGRFVDPWTVYVNQGHVTGRRIIIASGAKHRPTAIQGLEEAGYLNFHEALNLPTLPGSLFIVGGGPTGCSLAEIFNAFGCRVYLAEAGSILLQREDAEVGQVEAEILKNKGVHVFVNSEIKEVAAKPNRQKEVTVSEAGRPRQLVVDQLVLATGKIANLDLNLPVAGVTFEEEGVKVNRHLETTAKHIYAVGDVIGHDMLTHLAAYHSQLVVHNLFQTKAKNKLCLDYTAVSRYLPLVPEIAATGMTEAELLNQQIPYKRAVAPLRGLNRSHLSQATAGFVKLLSAADGSRLLGGSIIAPEAGEMIGQLSLAIKARLSVNTFRGNLKPFASWSEAFNLACQKLR